MTAETQTTTGPDELDLEHRLVFISHKSSDAELAKEVTIFFDLLSGGRIKAFNSSRAENAGPGFGKTLSEELKGWLARAALVILIYTDPTEQWEWCLWECGVATDPRDKVPTRVEVFTYSGGIPKPYESNLCVRLTSKEPQERAQDRVTLLRFGKAFCRDKDFLPDGRGPVAPGIADDSIERCVDDFLTRVEELECDLDEAKQRLRIIADELEAPTAEYLVPAVDKAVTALRWGLKNEPYRQLFDECWHVQYVEDLRKLSERTLVFRPPTVAVFWERLLDLVVDQPLTNGLSIRLVSGEANDPITFWLEAMTSDTSDARDYEAPVRAVAAKLFARAGHARVERRFLFDRLHFRDHPDDVDAFDRIVRWMTDAHIDVSVSRVNNASPEWSDFALIGDLAVSRFASVTGVANRVLEERFAPDTVVAARHAWEKLGMSWSSTGGQAFPDFMASSAGLI